MDYASVVITLAKQYGMERMEYNDGYYYDLHFEMNNGIRVITPSYDNESWVLQFKEDLSYAQICKPNLDFKEIKVDECLSKVMKIIELSDDFDFSF